MGQKETASVLSVHERKILNRLVTLFSLDGDIHGSLSSLKCINTLRVEFVLGLRRPGWVLSPLLKENQLKGLIEFFDVVAVEPLEVEGEPVLLVTAFFWL